MCGIGGILRVWPAGEPPPPVHESIPEGWLNILDDSIRHRGPDGQGRFRQRVVRPDGATVDVALVHRRLSIIDHAGGAQPMVLGRGGDFTTEAQKAQSGSEIGGGAARGRGREGQGGEGPRSESQGSPRREGEASGEGGRGSDGPRLWLAGPAAPAPEGPWAYRGAPVHVCPKCGPETLAVVFNGCIYNHRELRRELQGLGHEFHSDHSDTEVLLHGWREWGRDLPSKLDGMFALGLWDARLGRLGLMRDPFGEKPLFRGNVDSGDIVAFASGAAPLVRLRRYASSGLDLDADSLAGWTRFGWSQNALSKHLDSFYPGWIGFFPGSSDDASPGEGWHANVWAPRSDAVSADQIDSLLRAAVESRTHADVSVGCFLSGGIDSALIAKYASDCRRDIACFTVRMPHPSMDESEDAALTARHLGLNHHILDCEADPGADLESLIAQIGLPFGDSSLLPTSWVSRAARQAVRVALSGDGGDELFLGYERHRVAATLARLNHVPRVIRLPAARLAPRGGRPSSRRSRLTRLLNASLGEGYKELLAIFPPDLLPEIGIEHGRGPAHLGQTLCTSDRSDTLKLVRRFDLMFYLPEDLLRKTDTASMSVALEARAPMLARGVASAAINAAWDTLMPGGQRKGLLRQVARKYFPAEIVDRPKQGFAIPIGDWFRSDYGGMRQLLYDHLEGPDPFPGLPLDINMKFVKRMLREHDAAGEKSLNPWHGRDHSQRLYMLLVLSIWAKWLAGLPGPGGP